jgi:hypothetical protein
MQQRPSENRIVEALLTGAHYFTVACPKDMTMYSDAVKTSGNEENMIVRDLVDYVAEAMELEKLTHYGTYESDSESSEVENDASELHV